MTRKYFGTDGIRGEVGAFPMTPEFVTKLGFALGRVLRERGHIGGKVIIGKDSRISGYIFEGAIQAGLLSAGIDVHLLGVMPTPSIAYFTRTFQAAAGVVISASHNPYSDNGIKIFSQTGEKLPDDEELLLEQYIDEPIILLESSQLGKAYRIEEARGRYIEFCKNSIPLGLPLQNLKVVLDCANGATYPIAPNVFRELGLNVLVTSAEPNGCNINSGCGSTHPEALQRRVRDEGADIGIAFDGDGDRVIMVDKFGRLVDGDLILYIIACYRKFKGECLEHIVGTVMTNIGIEIAFKKLGVQLHRSAVGDRYVMELLQQLGAHIGGENSGHIICLDRNSTGDGIIAALQVLAAMVEMKKSLHEFVNDVSLAERINADVRIKNREIFNKSEVQTAIQEAEATLGNQGRILVRPSGTEPKIRVMAEGSNKELLGQVANYISRIILENDNA